MADVAAVAVWAATGAGASFWPVWVILVSALRLARDGWRLFGPAGELESGASDGGLGGDGRPAGLDERHARHLARREEHAARHAARRDAAVERRRRH
jgi:hypothetical protein